MFNAHRATYAARILLFEALKNIDQEWHATLNKVISAFQQDWENRNNQTSSLIIDLLEDALSFKLVSNLSEDDNESDIRVKLHDKYTREIKRKEKRAQEKMRALFKHNIFNYDLPEHSIIHQDLFSKKTWHFLGLERKQMLMLGAIGGAAAGVTLDLATLGSSFGLFGSIGGAIGAAGAFMSSRNFSSTTKLLGVEIGNQQLQVGPNESIQFLFVLLDRTFLFYSHIINWAHGRRDYDASSYLLAPSNTIDKGQTKSWSNESLTICHDFFSTINNDDESKKELAAKKMKHIIHNSLMELSMRESFPK